MTAFGLINARQAAHDARIGLYPSRFPYATMRNVLRRYRSEAREAAVRDDDLGEDFLRSQAALVAGMIAKWRSDNA